VSIYTLQFILYVLDTPVETIQNAVREFGEDLEIIPLQHSLDERGTNFEIKIHTEDPTIIFDTCAQFGRIKSVKIDEENSGGS